MPLKPPTHYSKAVRQTLHWLVESHWLDRPLEARGETQYLLCHAERLHESLTRLPHVKKEDEKGGPSNSRCLVVGSWGLEVPYLIERLGYTDVTCICAPNSPNSAQTHQSRDIRSRENGDANRRRSRHIDAGKSKTRKHPNADQNFSFTLLEHDLESGPLPFDDSAFGLIVFWGCFEHLRHDPEFGLYEINRVTAPGGCLSLVTDNAISFQMTHSVLRGMPMPMRLHHPAPEGHWRLYTPPEIDELLRGTGWTVNTLTSIVPDPPVYWRWWKRWVFKKLVAGYRKGFGLSEPFWNAFILAQATKAAAPARQYPKWLYKDEKIRALKHEMLELVTSRVRPVGV